LHNGFLFKQLLDLVVARTCGKLLPPESWICRDDWIPVNIHKWIKVELVKANEMNNCTMREGEPISHAPRIAGCLCSRTRCRWV